MINTYIHTSDAFLHPSGRVAFFLLFLLSALSAAGPSDHCSHVPSSAQPHFFVSGTRARQQASPLHPLAKQQAHAALAFMQPAPIPLRILVAEDNKVNQKVVLKVSPGGGGRT